MEELIEQWNRQFDKKSPEEILTHFLNEYDDRIALASSLGLEDQVLTDMIVKVSPTAKIFTIDTGRLFPETYSLIEKTNMKYNIKISIYFPNHQLIEDFVKINGINPFYESVEKRKNCCQVRKINPLLRALSDLDVWICGLRQEQSVTRTKVQTVEWDEANKLIKINPLVHWSEQKVWEYINQHQVPYNVLHKRGFPSIGCQPCTRAVAEGEDVRAGRWWWENPEQKECGLHKR
ncbi:MAG: phosphoadenylyl-sulfate reductase [Flavobacteriaceae bacterium]|jgi:phosphoadenosine phosphosulfate reductase|nr:phosphoadenylyl-sulfate reductase [Flavobacteriaceae bacterium]